MAEEATQEAEAVAPEIGMGALVGEESKNESNEEATTEPNPHLEADAEPQGDEPDDVEFVQPEWLPDKFWDPENGVQTEKLAKSFAELEKKFSRGDHKAPKEYDTKFLGEDIPEDDDMLNNYMDMAKRYGFSQDDFQGLAQQFIDGANQKVMDEQEYVAEQRRLLGKNGVEMVKSNFTWAEGLINKGIINKGEFELLDKLGGSADGTRLMRKLRNLSGEQEIPIPSLEGERKTKEELQSYVADPRWRDDPVWRAQKEKEFYDNIQ
tara:strand:+ start:679 stop:1473 length:795 start_codon:yes stop_codon:yes gene_type:complete